jgi:AT hook motif
MPASHAGAFVGVLVPPKPDKAPVKARKPKDPNAPKRPRGRPRKDATQPSAKQDTDASTSDSESDELQIEEIPEPLPDLLRGPPPEVAEHRVIYDIAVAVWSPRNKPAVAEKVRKGIALFGDVVKKQRDAWKVKNEALKQAELANTTAIPSLKQEVAQFRKTIETMAVQALRFGHPAHLAKYVSPICVSIHRRCAKKWKLKMELSGNHACPLYVALRKSINALARSSKP